MSEQPQQLPPGATPIDTDELLAAIGELYLQVRVMRRMIAAQQLTAQRQEASNGTVHMDTGAR